jgi:hypothetical protein
MPGTKRTWKLETAMQTSGDRIYLDFTNEGVVTNHLGSTFADGSREMVRGASRLRCGAMIRNTSRAYHKSPGHRRGAATLWETAVPPVRQFLPRIEPARLELYRDDEPDSNMMADQDLRVTRDAIRAQPE